MTEALFNYSTVTPETIRDGCGAAVRRAEALVAEIAALPDGRRTFANTLLPMEEIADLLRQAGGRYAFLAQVASDAALRDTAREQEERLDQYGSALGFREELYRSVLAFSRTAQAQALEGVEARLLEHTLRDFRRNGLGLPAAARKRVQESKERLVTLGISFRRNIDEYDDGLWLTREQLAGLPDTFVKGLRGREQAGGTRYRVSLDYPELHPVLDSADDAAVREELFRKNHSKAADTNLPVLAEAIDLRHEIATALDYPSWADYVIELRVAKTAPAVRAFLVDLERRVRPKAEQDMRALRSARGGGQPIALWDWRYYTQRILREQYHVDPFEVAEYFPLDATLSGLFRICEELLGVRFLAQSGANAWDTDVQLFEVVNARDGRGLAHFYLDLFPRPDKYGHAAAFSLRGGRTLPEGTYQRPISAIVANFTKPTASTPSLLRHSEVVTLFHEFGHILHQTLTQVPHPSFAGTQVERDFVEAPSQMLEHWCWSPEVLRSFSRHHRSGDPLPAQLVERMVEARNLSSGIATLRQIYFSRLDLAYHEAGAGKDTDRIAEELHPITGFAFPSGTHVQAGFGHLFGYDAGYYSYLWSRVYGDDMFTRFEETDLRDPGVGQDYRRLILERGGSVDGDALVRDFLDREPNPEAFLRHLGLDGSR